MRRALRYGFLVFALMFGIGIGASPGWADTSCPTSYLCMWTSPNFTGSKRTLLLCCGHINLVYPYDNNISSWKDRSNRLYRAYEGYNATGSWWTGMGNCGQAATMSANTDNEVSSIEMTSYPGGGC